MPRNPSRPPFDPLQTLKKLFLSGFVLVTFAAYATYERLTRPDSALAQGASTATASPDVSGPQAPVTTTDSLPQQASTQPTTAPAPTQQSLQQAAGYKNGTFQGPAIDAYYGLVQVQISIQGGVIKDVQFLQYPSDRRTSQQINAIAMPYLKEEAIQAQSASVDLISGATLTSEGFIMSLQQALQSAHN